MVSYLLQKTVTVIKLANMAIDFKQTKLQLVGIVTLGEVVQQIIVEQKFTIRELVKYITGGYER